MHGNLIFNFKIGRFTAGIGTREIEQGLRSGEVKAVVTTSALELGIDIGDLDLCLLVGYPGTVMSTWQRGGRVGRSGHDSAIVLIAGEDALDQYFMRHPKEFFNKGPEAAVINPDNTDILKKHLVCAAAELPLELDEQYVSKSDQVFSKIQIIGDAVDGWDIGRPMVKSKINPNIWEIELVLKSGELRFRNTDTWDYLNWGGNDSLHGKLDSYGQNIKVAEGRYHIIFNLDKNDYLIKKIIE